MEKAPEVTEHEAVTGIIFCSAPKCGALAVHKARDGKNYCTPHYIEFGD